MIFLFEVFFIVQPNFTSIVFRASNDGISLVVESTTEYFILMSWNIERKPSSTCNYSPESWALQIMAVLSALAVMILVPWGLKTALEISASWPALPVNTMQDADAVAGGHVVHPRSPVRTRAHQFRPHRVEVHVQHLVDVSRESLEDLSRSHIPDFARSVDTPRCHEFTREFELCWGYFTLVVFQHTDAFSGIYVPNLII